jgi:hypothetical protein
MRRNGPIVAMTLAGVLALTTLAGCSREKIDWKSAEAADTVEGYDHFIELHPDSALVTQARTRVTQLNEDRDWKKATAADTADAYRQFLAQHENGKWAEEARIRVENFSLDGTAGGPSKPAVDAQPVAAVAAPAPAGGSKEGQPLATPKPAAVAKTPASEPASAAAKPTAASTTAKPTAASAAAKSTATVKPASQDNSVAAAQKPAAVAKPAAGAEAMPPGQFGIQLGAFHTQEAALKSWKQLQVKFDSELHGLFAHAVPVKQASGQLFRLQAPVGAESRARAICASLGRQSQPCVVVLP